MTRWLAIFALVSLIGPISPISSAPAEARTFEQQLKKAQHVERLSRVIGPFLQQCRSGSSLRAIQCRAIRARMRHRVKNGTYWTTVDAVQVGKYNNSKLNFPVSVVGCLTCDGPAKLDPTLYGKQNWYVTTGKPRAIKQKGDSLRFVGLELEKIVRPVGPSQVESWMRSVRPNLKVQIIYRIEGDQWKAAGGRGLAVKLVGYRLYNQCSGKVLASKPPSTEPGPRNKNANCGRRRVVVRRVEPRRRQIPRRLSGRDIKQGMKRIGSLIQECYDRYQVPGLAEAMVTVKGATGKVSKVKILGKFKDSPTTGKCLREAVRKARFPKFRTTRMSFRYRWYLR